MRFLETPLAGAFSIEIEPHVDDRGFFARVWAQDELSAQGLDPRATQANIGFSARAGTLRGLHYQAEPFSEVKIVRCIAGRIFDVIVDLRVSSPTHRRWFGIELNAENRRALYVPESFAHGYLTLTDAAEILYLTSAPYQPSHARGVRHDDPAFGIQWPAPIQIISDADRGWPQYVNGLEA
jgi:dTDP-4-dehydrorhamnose 3,5-epimerase